MLFRFHFQHVALRFSHNICTLIGTQWLHSCINITTDLAKLRNSEDFFGTKSNLLPFYSHRSSIFGRPIL